MSITRQTCIAAQGSVTHMVKTQVYLPEEDVQALREAAKRSGRSVAG